MVIGYGQDDRVCAFTSLFAMLETENPERTSCCILVDKEEIGSVGATGMHSRFFEDYVAELMALTEDGNPLKVRRALRNSYMRIFLSFHILHRIYPKRIAPHIGTKYR